jgi:L-glyceraldehyde reductase
MRGRTENQPEVAIGIERSGVPRKDLFLVGKLWNTHHRPHLVQEDLEMSLDELKTNYLDVYLMHFPVAFKPGKEMQPLSSDGESHTVLGISHFAWHFLCSIRRLVLRRPGKLVIDPESPGITKTWAEVCRLYKEKKGVRAIGVSNFTIAHLEAIIKATGVVPAVNQIEGHPSLIQKDLYAYCKLQLSSIGRKPDRL